MMIVDPKHRFPLVRFMPYGDQLAELPHFASPVTRAPAAPDLQVRREGRLVRASRRIFDVTMSLVMAVFLAPVMLLAALAIAIDSPGPVFYRQTSVGLNGRPFRITKFRSMRRDAEGAGVAVWAATEDPRITAVGRILRKYRIDELPQFFDVLRGDMSIIGPRPERPEFVAILRESIPDYDLRHAVKPGITGLAQVRYAYGASVEDARIKHIYDTEYLRKRSFLLDGKILIETVSVVLFGKGAR
ncbi:sugar transferase [Acidiphilium multivorum]|uniref:sugar transferase n=1 Tax=Acidiphilium multivorum TaxID=62140 RepID=UPI001B8B40E8|nr:sugar transferase [Acidiphilium multivorum]MBS3023486.1 sugar transferase [Acidiphilium multivorum]